MIRAPENVVEASTLLHNSPHSSVPPSVVQFTSSTPVAGGTGEQPRTATARCAGTPVTFFVAPDWGCRLPGPAWLAAPVCDDPGPHARAHRSPRRLAQKSPRCPRARRVRAGSRLPGTAGCEDAGGPEAGDAVEVLVVPGSGFSYEDQYLFIEALHRRLGPLGVSVRTVSKIPPEASEKHTLVKNLLGCAVTQDGLRPG